MTVFLTEEPGGVLIQARAEAPGVVGDLTRLVVPGEAFLGLGYEEWLDLARTPPGPDGGWEVAPR